MYVTHKMFAIIWFIKYYLKLISSTILRLLKALLTNVKSGFKVQYNLVTNLLINIHSVRPISLMNLCRQIKS